MIITVEKQDLTVRTDFTNDQIKFWHEPQDEGCLGAEGVISFDSNYKTDGDGITTPVETIGSYGNVRIIKLEVNDETGIVTDVPFEYVENLLSTVIDNSEIN